MLPLHQHHQLDALGTIWPNQRLCYLSSVKGNTFDSDCVILGIQPGNLQKSIEVQQFYLKQTLCPQTLMLYKFGHKIMHTYMRNMLICISKISHSPYNDQNRHLAFLLIVILECSHCEYWPNVDTNKHLEYSF